MNPNALPSQQIIFKNSLFLVLTHVYNLRESVIFGFPIDRKKNYKDIYV